MTDFSKEWDKKENKETQYPTWVKITISFWDKETQRILLDYHPDPIHKHIAVSGSILDFKLECLDCDFKYHYKKWWKFW